jgi:hypothetical protein
MNAKEIVPVKIRGGVFVGDETRRREFVEGRPIEIQISFYEGGLTKCWDFLLEGEDCIYRVRFPWESHIFKAIVLSLAGDRRLSRTDSLIRLSPYQKDGKPRIRVTDRGKSLRWITTDLPPVKPYYIVDAKCYDTTERMNFIVTFVEQINYRLK